MMFDLVKKLIFWLFPGTRCEVCENGSVEITHKCETCDLLLCEKCEASHTASDSHGGTRTTKTISAIAGDMRTEINRVLKDLKDQEEILAKKLSDRPRELDNIRQASDKALKAIAEKEDILIAKIKSHHDNLKKELEIETAKHIAKSKKELKNVEVCYHDVMDKQVLLNSWVRNRSDVSVVNTAEQIQKKLQDIEKESSINEQHCSSAETFSVKFLDVDEYDSNSSTKLYIATDQAEDEKESEDDSSRGSDKSPVKEASVSDYTSAPYRDYVKAKMVTINGTYFGCNKIYNIKQYNGHLYCMEAHRIHVYTKNLALVKTIALHVYCKDVACVNNKYLITACSSTDYGLSVINTDGEVLQRICPGEFCGLAIHDQKLYAYEYNINKVLIFEQTDDCYWKQSGDIYLNYNGNNEHKIYSIQSFQLQKEQIYIADDTFMYHLDMKGNLKRNIRIFKKPHICGVDSKGNLLVAESEKQVLTVIDNDGKCGVISRRADDLENISSAYIGDENEFLWIAHSNPDKSVYYITKYKATNIQSVLI